MDRARQFAAFVPDLVLERLASDPAAPATAREDAFLAAILFVDIVGYVPVYYTHLTLPTNREV